MRLPCIASYAQDLLSFNDNNQSKQNSFKYFKSLFEPNGVIDIAFLKS
jgi:spectinomycin phosphotransferase